jgi:pimeloyl-ACP methyl ester carboxylesterase
MAEQVAKADGIEIAHEAFGDASDPAMLLIMGLGMQMLGWDERFCRMLAERGYHVIRFDNRDVGLSMKIEGGPAPDALAAIAGDASSASYTLSEMGGDAVWLLDRLGIEAAHIVGASQGGMIAQTVAIEHPERVLSLTSIMSTTGDRAVGQPHPEGMAALFNPPPSDREGLADWAVRNWHAIGSPGYPAEDERIRERALASYDRSYYPEGFARQLVAVIASGDRTEKLAGVRVPTLVIHGEDDPLIDVSGGEATARAIPGAQLILIPGMGHDLPLPLWPKLADAIVENCARAGAPAGGS